MPSLSHALDAVSAVAYIGQTVLMELHWDDDYEMLWRCYHVVGVVLPVPGVFEDGYFLIMPFCGGEDLPFEVYFDSINTIRVIKDRHAVGKVLGRLPLPHLFQTQEGRRTPPCVSHVSSSTRLQPLATSARRHWSKLPGTLSRNPSGNVSRLSAY